MITFEAILALLAGAVLIAGAANRLKVPYPALLALAGAVLAVSPFKVPLSFEPSLVLALLVAPVLVDAGYGLSYHDLRAYWLVVSCLVFFAVGLTTLAVSVIAHTLQPHLPWSAAIVLGAIVAPPDAAAATAILKPLDAPRRISVALEGESLLNDASSLLLYRAAVAATGLSSSSGAHLLSLAPSFAVALGGSVLLGPLMANATLWITRKLDNVESAIILQFTNSFFVWLLADFLKLSPVLSVVAYALTLSRCSPDCIPARLRRPSEAVWKTAVLALNAVAFVFIGLQLRPILAGAPKGELLHWCGFAAAVLAAVIGVRIVWAMTYNFLCRRVWVDRGVFLPVGQRATVKGGMIISWCGMRGIVTLASALALPRLFPDRPLLVFTAFFVTLGTLLLQGLTLRPLLLLLKVHDDLSFEEERRKARAELASAALAALEGASEEQSQLLAPLLHAQHAEAVAEVEGRATDAYLKWAVLEKRRSRLNTMRRNRVIGDHVFHLLQEELDHHELMLAVPEGNRA